MFKNHSIFKVHSSQCYSGGGIMSSEHNSSSVIRYYIKYTLELKSLFNAWCFRWLSWHLLTDQHILHNKHNNDNNYHYTYKNNNLFISILIILLHFYFILFFSCRLEGVINFPGMRVYDKYWSVKAWKRLSLLIQMMGSWRE